MDWRTDEAEDTGDEEWIPAYRRSGAGPSGRGLRGLQRPEPVGGRHCQVQWQPANPYRHSRAGVTPAQQQAQLEQQRQALTKGQHQAAEEAKIAANKAAAAANKRCGELADYNIWDDVTVLVGNGQVNIDPQYNPKLLALAQKAKTVSGYAIQ
jgi:hypothetical protein